MTKKLSQFQLKIDLSIVHTTGRNQIHVGFLHFNFQSEIFKQERKTAQQLAIVLQRIWDIGERVRDATLTNFIAPD